MSGAGSETQGVGASGTGVGGWFGAGGGRQAGRECEPGGGGDPDDRRTTKNQLRAVRWGLCGISID